ncbi:MAG TPA: DUF1501 domain-containing protein, partial [Pirellulales bacterium]|nr:DUF1501 domain-containing protein [Pirellulales bacterium]
MLKLFPRSVSNCQQSRRQFMLEIGTIAGTGLSLDLLLRAKAAKAEASGVRAGDVKCILIWTRGGTSHHDTLDPKPEAPSHIRGEFGVIDTALPGVKFTDQMPKFARELNRYALLRNLNPLNGAHGTADAIMMSGKRFSPATVYPCFGSVVAKQRGFSGNMPPYVQVGTAISSTFGGGAPGYLGLAYGAFVLPGDPSKPDFKVRDVTPAPGVGLERIDRRREALVAVDRLQREIEHRPDLLEAMDEHYRHAFDMITAPTTQRAFDLNRESAKTRDAYGKTSLGQSCLLARRLIEAGTQFVTVTSDGWDTHQQNFSKLRTLLPELDQAFPALVADLEQRGLLDTTLVVWMTDFGRTPDVNNSAGRDHWSTASVLCMAGAGTPPGQVLGATDDIGGRV